MQLMRYMVVWLMRMIEPNVNFPKQEMTLPLPTELPMAYRCLPEYYLEDIVDNFKHIVSRLGYTLPPTQCEEIVTACIAFLSTSNYIKNPYLKAGLVSILFYGILPPRVPGRTRGVLTDFLNGSPFCHKHLLHSLMRFYIDCESTGSHTQFYDKFNIRYEIFEVMKVIWTSSIYRERLNVESKVNVDFFVHFVNLLLNDVTYVLGESFENFQKIRDLQQTLENPNHGLSEDQVNEKQEALDHAQRIAKNTMVLTNETVAMLKLFTEVLDEAFTMPEVVQRLADMLV